MQELVKGKSQRQAYHVAYPNSKKWKDSSVDSNASTLLANAKVKQRYLTLLERVNEKLTKDTIASKQEVLEYFTRLMRREEKEQIVSSVSRKKVWTDESGNRREESTRDPVTVEIDTKVADSFKGAEALAKHYGVLVSQDGSEEELNAVDKLLRAMEADDNE